MWNIDTVLSEYYQKGYHGEKFTVLGHEGLILGDTTKDAKNRPWIWRMEFPGAYDYVDCALLNRNWNYVYVSMSDWYGAPDAIDFMKKANEYVISEYNLNRKTNLIGLSRGGLYALNYAVKNPEMVETLYLDAPVVNLASWPGGFLGNATHLIKEWNEALDAYQMNQRQLLNEQKKLPIKFQLLCDSRIPVILVAGLKDNEVPYIDNGEQLAMYLENNSKDQIKVILKENCGHHPHGLNPPDEIVNFILSKNKE